MMINIISVVKVIILSFYYFLFIIADHKVACQNHDHVCPDIRCGVNEPPIRFPFRLYDQPSYCGFFGFELQCNGNNRTEIELPANSGMKFLVKEISYKSQEIHLYNKYYKCKLEEDKLKILDLSIGPPFEFSSAHLPTVGSILFNCSSSAGFEGTIYCIRAVESTANIGLYLRELVSCTKIVDKSSLPPELFRDSNFQLTWRNPSCAHCEAKGKRCGLLKRKGAEIETECFGMMSKTQEGNIN